METTVISQIAQKVFYKNSKIPKELQKSSKTATGSVDTVSLSSKAVEFQKDSVSGTEFEQSREQNIERIKSLVQDDNYQIDKELIDKIAEKIAAMFL